MFFFGTETHHSGFFARLYRVRLNCKTFRFSFEFFFFVRYFAAAAPADFNFNVAHIPAVVFFCASADSSVSYI